MTLGKGEQKRNFTLYFGYRYHLNLILSFLKLKLRDDYVTDVGSKQKNDLYCNMVEFIEIKSQSGLHSSGI